MAPLIKDTLEIATPVTEASQPVREKPAAPAMRADALSLEVQVKVHGSKVTEIGRGLPPRTEPFEELTSTMIVFPQGAVLRLAAGVNAGQTVVLTNLKTRKDAICRVVKVRANTNLQTYVEVEFTSTQSGYWGVTFGGASASAPAPVASRPAAPPPAVSPVSTSVPPAPSIVPPPPPKSSSPVSSFALIGSQEKVQPSASEISKPVPPAPLPRRADPIVPPPALEPSLDEAKLSAAIGAVPPAEIPLASASISLEDLIGDSKVSVEPELASASGSPEIEASIIASAAAQEKSAPLSHSDRPIFGTFAAAAAVSTAPPVDKTFGVRLDDSLSTSAPAARSSSHSLGLIAACVGFLLIASAAGFFFMRSHAAMHASASGPSASQSSANPLPSAPADSSILAPSVSSTLPGSVSAAPSRPVASTVPAAAAGVTPSAAPAAAPPASTAAARVPPPSSKPAVTGAMVSETLNAHPVAAQRPDGSSAEAPAMDSSGGDSDSSPALPGAISSPSDISIPTPRMVPDGPLKIGGEVKEPRLVNSPPPLYPPQAVLMNIEGDVVIQAVIDKQGKVSEMRVVSGPTLLRQAAIDALHHWRYEPSVLDGQPIAVQMLVTIHFRRQ